MADNATLLGQAKEYHRSGRLHEAEQLYREILAADAVNPQVLYLLGAACYGLGKSSEAALFLERAVKIEPNHSEARHHLGVVYMQHGRLDDAVAQLQESWRLSPQSPQTLHHLKQALAASHDAAGMALVRKGCLDEAAGRFREALAIEPTCIAALGNLGNVLKNQGHLDEAEACYRRALEVAPESAQAYNDLGLIHLARGAADVAVTSFRRAVELQATLAEAHTNLGTALASQGKYEEAEASCRRALELRPDLVEAHTDLANVLTKQKKYDQALACCVRALELNPKLAVVHVNAGIVQAAQKKPAEAAASYRRAIELQPDNAQAHNNLGVILAETGQFDAAAECYAKALAIEPTYFDPRYNLGLARTSQNRLVEAADCYRQVLRLKPDHLAASCSLCLVLLMQKRDDEAIAIGRRLLEFQPKSPLAHGNLGDVFADQDKFDEAAVCYARALELDPADAQIYNSRVALSLRQNKLDEAQAFCTQALTIDKEHADAHFSQAYLHLLNGRLAEGWLEYEWRFRRKGREEGTLAKPRWDGSPLEGRTILLRCEQGLGDTVQFVRYAERVSERGGKVIVQCQRQLTGLLSSCPGVDRVVAVGDPLPDFDVHIPLMSLPLIFGTTLESIPAKVPYLSPDEAAVARWKGELGDKQALKVGIAWQGSPSQLFDRARSIPVVQFAGLAGRDGVQLFSLQMGLGREQLKALELTRPIVDLGDRLGDFNNTAAIVRNLDLIITCDSAPAHLAGALGLPVWVALPLARDWRWLLDRSDSPWYPTMRLFRQTAPGQWSDVFQKIEGALVDLAASRDR